MEGGIGVTGGRGSAGEGGLAGGNGEAVDAIFVVNDEGRVDDESSETPKSVESDIPKSEEEFLPT